MKPLSNQSLRVIFLAICLLFTQTCFAQFHKSLWPQWLTYNPLSQDSISHQEWQTFLARNVTTNKEGINQVAYATLSRADRDLLRQYIQRLSKTPIERYNRQEQLAFWLNLYNALTIQTIAESYPVPSVQDVNISPGLFSVGPWGANVVSVNNTDLTLDEIHNRIIRPIWNDPRTHYAINNGAIGAPNIRKEAYQGRQLERQLNEQAYQYVNSLRGVQVIEGKLIVSKLYDWFNEDFGGNETDIIYHLSQFSQKPLKHELETVASISSYMYNWHLNSQSDTPN